MNKGTLVGHVVGFLTAMLLGVRAVTYLRADNVSDATLMGLGAAAILCLLYQARSAPSRKALTDDQVHMMKGLIAKELESIEKRRQEIINEGAKKGGTISTEKVLNRLENLKSTYHGPDREEYLQEVDRLAHEFREKHGPQIPVDDAYRILKEIEQKYST